MMNLDELSAKLGMDISKHIEEFACAYYKKTQIDPTECELVIRYGSEQVTYYFQKRLTTET